MRVLIIVDETFAERERSLISRLGVGLADEGIGVAVAVPEARAEPFELDLFVDPVPYRMNGFVFTRGRRAAHLRRRLGVHEPDDPGIDLVHVYGGSAWAFAVEIADQLEVPLAVEVWRRGVCDRARALRRRTNDPILCFAPDRAIERRLLADAGSTLVRLARWGGSTGGATTAPFRDGRAPSFMIAGNGRDPAGLTAAFRGAQRVVQDIPGALLFLDAEAASRAGLRRLARELGVLDRVTLVDRMEDRRDLVLRGDVLVCPERLREHHTLVLDAMAAGMPVVAPADAEIDAIVPGQTALVVPRPHPDAWHEALSSLMADPDAARALGASAREAIRDGRRFSAYVAAIIDAYEWVTSTDSVRIESAASA